ncbi:protein kinase domain-containing protein [Chitinophaga sp. LS1]|uniref:protein kinase domain-containing protein n=1 Tax=Chitinophaga sp. LS1 TaxID=3051176 RepID=UPI002AAC42D9|nr:lanthionine synthetase LanC family protein [Chitinophaga sp. LS1]WPV67815.1 lanthionine synthetase LanC family protein [Chitinophaga sp. LS1]
MNSSSSDRTINIVNDYTEILNRFGIEEKEVNGYYYQIGESYQKQGWIINISIWDIHFQSLSEYLLPRLKCYNVAYLIPMNSGIHSMLQNGLFGYKNLGKIITIYLQEENQLLALIKELIEMTKYFNGPEIPTDFHLESLVYTRYGSYTQDASEKKYIFDNKGNKILDEESIPPVLYDWAPWPFNEIRQPTINSRRKILNEKYLVTKSIKPDVKGEVMKGIYQHSFLNFKKCIIKEGKKGMSVDIHGRQMSDRLKWQYETHKKLKKKVPIPDIIEFFQEYEETYLVFEFIDGKSLNNLLTDIYEGNTWEDLSFYKKNQIIDVLIKFIKAVDLLHANDYIHRDLNIENVFIDKNNEVWLIDLELSFDLKESNPFPPYERGTEGYMSPEQKDLLYPTIQQDIFSIGAILVMSFVHITPYKFNFTDKNALNNILRFFISDEEINNLISSCLDNNMSNRPNLNKIIENLSSFKRRLNDIIPKINTKKLNKKALEIIIKNSLLSLNYSGMLSSQNYWSSPISTKEAFIGNFRADRTIYTGFRKGVSGIIFLIGQAAKVGLNIEPLKENLEENFPLVSDTIFNSTQMEPGLFDGSYSLALAILSLIQGHLLPKDDHNISLVQKCLNFIPSELNLSYGIAGYGITLLKCKDIVKEKFTKEKLNYCIDLIINKQLSNGAWRFDNNVGKSKIVTGFSYGIAGIIWFLLNYVEIYNDETALSSALKGLQYLKKISKRSKQEFRWQITSSSKEVHEFKSGGYFLLLPFIKAYKITKNPLYKKIVEGTLYAYPQHVVADFSSIERGVAGLGEVYLEAWQTFGNKEWHERASWIVQLLIHTSYKHDKYEYWLQTDPYNPHADLLTGQSGIIHFLLKYNFNDGVSNLFD